MISPLIAENAEATAWMDQAKQDHASEPQFGKLASAVIWSDVKGADGQQILPIDPEALAADINRTGYRLLKGHDPGFPTGKVLTAAVFTSSDGTKFVAALLGLYQGSQPVGFRDLGVEASPIVEPPLLPPKIPESWWIEFHIDPREVDAEWVESVLATAPLAVEREDRSNNAADAAQELISVGLFFGALLWTPFLKTIGTEAGKDAYAALHDWVKRLLNKLSERRNPILEIQSNHNGCYVSFMFRGTDVKRHYMAHDAQPAAATQAVTLIENLQRANAAPKFLVYEFHSEQDIWFPSFAELHDGRFITDNKVLIAIEKLPTGLSLGIGLGREMPRLPPSVRDKS